MERNYSRIPFERYADDVVCHCRSYREANELKEAVTRRLEDCRLNLNQEKTKIVYCKDSNRKGTYEHISFTFLGYEFRPRRSSSKSGKIFTNFLPAVSDKAMKRMSETIRSWHMHRHTNIDLRKLADYINPTVCGWINYYGRFYPSAMKAYLRHLNFRLAAWVCRKYKRFQGRQMSACFWLGTISHRDKNLFYHWQWGAIPIADKRKGYSRNRYRVS